MTDAIPQAQVGHRGWLVFVLGVLGLGLFFLFGTFAWSMGNRHIAEMDEGLRDPAGRGMTMAGKILGMAGVILTVTGIIHLFSFDALTYVASLLAIAAIGRVLKGVRTPESGEGVVSPLRLRCMATPRKLSANSSWLASSLPWSAWSEAGRASSVAW